MENRNIREREELHKAIWSIADDLRGSVDGWDFKQYVLGSLSSACINDLGLLIKSNISLS